jgi:hypothetical protein
LRKDLAWEDKVGSSRHSFFTSKQLVQKVARRWLVQKPTNNEVIAQEKGIYMDARHALNHNWMTYGSTCLIR